MTKPKKKQPTRRVSKQRPQPIARVMYSNAGENGMSLETFYHTKADCDYLNDPNKTKAFAVIALSRYPEAVEAMTRRIGRWDIAHYGCTDLHDSNLLKARAALAAIGIGPE